jgi:16S rRNA (uracil1498-N3)-methyltransferase
MRLHRFYVTQPLGEEVVINDVPLLHQWINVFRYESGDLVILFNGDGNDYTYSLVAATKKSCTLAYSGKHVSYVPNNDITLCLSVIKKDNFELVVEKATELGISTVIPILSSRSENKNLSFERLEKIAKEASEQCGRGNLPSIHKITPLKEVLDSLGDKRAVALQMNEKALSQATLGKTPGLVLFIGPEGGWGEADLKLFKEYNASMFSLGSTVLRAETAAIASLSLLIL